MQYETAASLIDGYVSHFVPSLLQTASYARALISALNSTDPDEIAALVDLRLRRQEVISRDEFPDSLDVIIDESIFHRMVGTPTIMREQIVHLADAVSSRMLRCEFILSGRDRTRHSARALSLFSSSDGQSIRK
jgi:alkanesulfonate monooxygenase SsuD/methylene tetrahydromethanopterin reductase-like flavin-dependent oxidoreductase (luciferase family)